ncbi:hypothetical protein MTYP_02660 [Methylophilaceae bacterium]|nr:hypothetical protein MTYP_02660 [Methylophilaceae bacterium]
MRMNASKSHPMVLTAAVMLTLFSIIGSAAISGLIPVSQPEQVQAGNPEAVYQGKPNGHSRDASPKVVSKQAAEVHASKVQPVAVDAKPEYDRIVECLECGEVIAIETIRMDGESSGLGAVAGGIAGGLLGNQIGGGSGRTVMTVLGVGGGAYAGNTIEKKVKASTTYVVKVRTNDGNIQTITQNTQPRYNVGDKVRLQGGQLISA